MTQPALWHADLSREEDASLWLGESEGSSTTRAIWPR